MIERFSRGQVGDLWTGHVRCTPLFLYIAEPKKSTSYFHPEICVACGTKKHVAIAHGFLNEYGNAGVRRVLVSAVR